MRKLLLRHMEQGHTGVVSKIMTDRHWNLSGAE